MKKKVSIIMVLVIIIIGCATLSGCNENAAIENKLAELEKQLQDYSNDSAIKDKVTDLETANGSLKDELTDLKSKNTVLNDKVIALETRIAKIEKTIAAYEEINATNNKDLLAAITKVKNDLIANTASDSEIKAQVTEMQKKVDQIRFDSTEPVNLSKTQDMLNTLYGQVNPPAHKNGDTFDVGINGITYYTVTFYGEIHNSLVNTQATDLMPQCYMSTTHLCGRITIDNKMRRSISGLDMENLIRITYSTYSNSIDLMRKTDGNTPESIAAGEKVDLHFVYIAPADSKYFKENFDIVFHIATATIGNEIIKIAGATIPEFYMNTRLKGSRKASFLILQIPNSKSSGVFVYSIDI